VRSVLVILIAWATVVSVGCGFIAGYWLHQGDVNAAWTRGILYFVIMSLVFVIGFYYYRNQGTNSASVSDQTIATYWPAIKFSLFQQVGICVFAALVLDGGRMFQRAMIAVLAYWLMALFIILRRPRSPTPGDLLVIRLGYPLIFLTVEVVGPIVWALRGR